MVTGTSLGGIFVETTELDCEQIKTHKHTFVRAMFDAMSDIATRLEVSLIREHLISRIDGMATSWSDYFISDKILGAWFQFYISNNYTDVLIKAGKDVDYLFPVRCFTQELIIGNCLFWKLRGLNLEFSEIENYIVSHCSGKLSVFEIAERTHKKFGSESVPFDKVLTDVIDYVNQLSSELLVINRRLG